MNIIEHTVKRIFLYIFITVLFCGCAPTLLEHREAMTDHVGYQRYDIPTRYILRVVELNDTELKDCNLHIKRSSPDPGYFLESSENMGVMSNSEVAGFPPAYQYSIKELNDNEIAQYQIDSIDSIGYRYSCDYEGYTIFGRQNRTVYYPEGTYGYGPYLSFEKPLYLFWKETSGSNWNESYEENSNSNVIIENEGCFTINHVGQTRSIENGFSIKNNSAGTLYINHQLTRIIDVVTGTETPNDDRFIIELLDTYNNNLITLGAGQVVNFNLRYGITVAGTGVAEDNVFMRFKFGKTSSSFPKDFKIGAHMKFVKKDPSECA